MPYNGSGSFSYDAADHPAVANTTISSTKHNNKMADVATALSTCLLKDGQQTVTADIPMGNNKLTGVKDGTAVQDAATLANIINGTGVYVGTVGGTADVITLTPSPALGAYAEGQRFYFLAGANNTGAVTVNISALGAKALNKQGGSALVADDLVANSLVEMVYDGTDFETSVPAQTSGSITASGYTQNTEKLLGRTTTSSGAIEEIDPGAGLLLESTTLSTSSPLLLHNFRIAASISANAVVIALKGVDGNDPSASNKVEISMRDTTASTGSYNVRSVTSALSQTVLSSGSTLGVASSGSIRAYLWLVDSDGAGAMKWAVSRYAMWDWSALATTTAEGGAGAADDEYTLYSDAVYSSKPIRLVGVLELTSGATAGQWSSVDLCAVWTPGMHKTGDVVQIQRTDDGTSATGTNVIPADDTIPQLSETNVFISQAITPTNSLNTLDISGQLLLEHSAGVIYVGTLHQDSTANALAVQVERQATASRATNVSISYRMAAGTTSSTTLKLGGSAETAGTTRFNQESSADKYGGTIMSYLQIQEIYA